MTQQISKVRRTDLVTLKISKVRRTDLVTQKISKVGRLTHEAHVGTGYQIGNSLYLKMRLKLENQ